MNVGLTTSLPEGEFVVVQGTIDLAVIRTDEMWILDFKTDALKESDLKFALDNYAPQLRLYASALGRIYKRPVTKRWLHFLTLSENCRGLSYGRPSLHPHDMNCGPSGRWRRGQNPFRAARSP